MQSARAKISIGIHTGLFRLECDATGIILKNSDCDIRSVRIAERDVTFFRSGDSYGCLFRACRLELAPKLPCKAHVQKLV